MFNRNWHMPRAKPDPAHSMSGVKNATVFICERLSCKRKLFWLKILELKVTEVDQLDISYSRSNQRERIN